MPVYNTNPKWLSAAIASVRSQTYPHWELCIADDASPAPEIPQILARAAAADLRIKTLRLPRNLGIAAATNAAMALATGDFLALLDHDDTLAETALATIAAELQAHPQTDLLFSDEDHLAGTTRRRPYFKPGWNPDLMLGQNLISHLGVYRRSLAETIGFLRPGFEGSQDYDFALRAATQAGPGRIRHVPRVLYHWRQHRQAFSASRAETCRNAGRRAVADRLGTRAEVIAHKALPQWNRIRWRLPNPPPLISVILNGQGPMPNPGDYAPIEIVPTETAAQGEILLFLSANLQAAHPGWLRELASQALRPEIGAVGARLDAPHGHILQAGLVLDPTHIARSPHPRSGPDDPGYRGQFALARNVAAISLDCLAIRRVTFHEAGGLDPRAGAYADVDLCLRLAPLGLRCLWTPQAHLKYTVLPNPAPDPAGADLMRQRWADRLAADPYHNPNLTLTDDGNYALQHLPPPETRPAR